MKLAYSVSDRSINVLLDSRWRSVDVSSPNYNRLKDALRAKDKDIDLIRSLVDIPTFIARATFGRVQVGQDVVLFDGNAISGVYVTRLLRHLQEGLDIEPIARYLEKREQNPVISAREEMDLFFDAANTALAPDGDVFVFKKVQDDYSSYHTGRDGKKFFHYIDTELEMDEEEIDTNRYNTCSTGLHFCSYAYLPHYYGGQGRVVILKLNPAKIRSIPTDYNHSKGRAQGYKVVGEVPEDEAAVFFQDTPVYYGFDGDDSDDLDADRNDDALDDDGDLDLYRNDADDDDASDAFDEDRFFEEDRDEDEWLQGSDDETETPALVEFPNLPTLQESLDRLRKNEADVNVATMNKYSAYQRNLQSLGDLVMNGFYWTETAEGEEYWDTVYTTARSQTLSAEEIYKMPIIQDAISRLNAFVTYFTGIDVNKNDAKPAPVTENNELDADDPLFLGSLEEAKPTTFVVKPTTDNVKSDLDTVFFKTSDGRLFGANEILSLVKEHGQRGAERITNIPRTTLQNWLERIA